MGMIDYIRNLKRLLKMEDKKENINSIEELFINIHNRINHIEDAVVDSRKLMAKLVTQSNQIVKFLSSLEIEDVDEEMLESSYKFKVSPESSLPPMSEKSYKHIKELIDEFMSKNKSLEEFEEEMEKVKKLITPGQVSEA